MKEAYVPMSRNKINIIQNRIMDISTDRDDTIIGSPNC